jgi:hypothetical protein
VIDWETGQEKLGQKRGDWLTESTMAECPPCHHTTTQSRMSDNHGTCSDHPRSSEVATVLDALINFLCNQDAATLWLCTCWPLRSFWPCFLLLLEPATCQTICTQHERSASHAQELICATLTLPPCPSPKPLEQEQHEVARLIDALMIVTMMTSGM